MATAPEYYDGSASPPPPPAHQAPFPNPPPRTTASPFYGSDYAPSYRTTDPYAANNNNNVNRSSPNDMHNNLRPVNEPGIPGRAGSAAYQQQQPHQDQQHQYQQESTTSPFDSPFDDPIQPLDPVLQQDPQAQHMSASPYYRRDSLYSPSVLSSGLGSQRQPPYQPSFESSPYQQQSDTGYYGAGATMAAAVSSEEHVPDAIPLRDRQQKDTDVEMDDHIYDAPQNSAGGGAAAAPAGGGGSKKGYGELGMFSSGGRKRIPWVVYLISAVQIAVFIGEIARNGVLTGTPIQIKPTFNWMIGPSYEVLISMGARFVPCMHNLDIIQGSTIPISWPCPNTTTNDNLCSLPELCGFGGVPAPLYNGNVDQTPAPNQWFRFILPMFLHAGLIHIGFNLFLQLTLGREIEVLIGPIRFFLIYIFAGIFGFVFGGNYAGTAIASTGASGSLFGIMALVLLDLLYSWRERRRPGRDLLFVLLEIVISLVLGLLIPFIDNFAHIGGFIVGICMGVCLLHSPNSLRRRIGQATTTTSYNTMQGGPEDHDERPFYKNPVGFFKGRKPLWWAWWLIRAGALVLIIVAFIVLVTNFYKTGETCSWCKYLNCININDWCKSADLQIQTQSSPRLRLF